MKAKKKSIIIASALIVITAVLATAFLPKVFSFARNNKLSSYFSQDIKNVDNIELISPAQVIGGKSDTLAGIKESLRLGADSVIVDLCFKKDFTPVICSDYTVAESATPVEDLFKAMCTDEYKDISVYLNIIQLSDLSKLNELCVSYNLISRVFLTGIDKDHYGMITSDDTIIPLFLDYEITSDDVKSAEEGDFRVPEFLSKYGAFGIVIKAESADEEIVKTLNIYSVPFIVDNVTSEEIFCEAALSNAVRIITDTPERSREIIDLWTIDMQERHASSVEKSLEELSQKAGD